MRGHIVIAATTAVWSLHLTTIWGLLLGPHSSGSPSFRISHLQPLSPSRASDTACFSQLFMQSKVDQEKKEELQTLDILHIDDGTRNGHHQPGHKMTVPELLAWDISQNATNGFQSGSAKEAIELLYEMSDEIGNKFTSEGVNQMEEYFTAFSERQGNDLNLFVSEVEKYIKKIFEAASFADSYLLKNTDLKLPDVLMEDSDLENPSTRLERTRLIMTNSTLDSSRRRLMALRYFDVYPFYFAVESFTKWVRKLGLPPMLLARSLSTVLSTIRSNAAKPFRARQETDESYEEFLKNAEVMQAGWKRTGSIAAQGGIRRQWAILRRSSEIWVYFFRFLMQDRRISRKEMLSKWSPERVSKERSKLGAEITQNLLKLGPTFIKVGQLFSTRVDLLPKEYLEELKLLQDNVPPFSGDTAVKIIEKEIGKPIHEIFDSFERTALAGASLGQVHLATKGNLKFAVKVQRQFLKDLFEVDLGQIKRLAQIADTLDFSSEGGLFDRNTKRDWKSVYDQYEQLIYEEIDYVNEMKNCDRFRKNFDNRRFRHIRAPKTYAEYTTDKVLCMEFLPGIKITDSERLIEAGLDPQDVSIKSAEAFFEQIFRHGFYHSDPHPGNIAVEADSSGKCRLIFYDFGMMGSFPEAEKKALVDFTFAVYYDADVKLASDALERMGCLRIGPDVDKIAVSKVGQDFIDRFQETLKRDASWENELSEEERKRINRERRKQLGEEFMSLNSGIPFNFPPGWTFIFRAFTSLDGIGKSLNPRFDFTKIMLPYLKELLDLKDGNAFVTTASRVGKRVGLRWQDINQAVTQPRRVAKVEGIVRDLERGDLKPRVRAPEVERKLGRQELVQSNIFLAVLVTALLQTGVTIAGSEFMFAVPLSRLFFAGAAYCGALRLPRGMWKVRELDKYEERYGVSKKR